MPPQEQLTQAVPHCSQARTVYDESLRGDMPASVVALIGQQNQPLYIRAAPGTEGEQLVKLHYVVHCSLDAVEEKVLQKRAANDAAPSPYLGLLYPIQELKVYGYLTNTGVKVIAALDDVAPKDEAVTRLLRRIHHAYVDLTANPFFTFGASIKSERFDSAVEVAVTAFSRT